MPTALWGTTFPQPQPDPPVAQLHLVLWQSLRAPHDDVYHWTRLIFYQVLSSHTGKSRSAAAPSAQSRYCTGRASPRGRKPAPIQALGGVTEPRAMLGGSHRPQQRPRSYQAKSIYRSRAAGRAALCWGSSAPRRPAPSCLIHCKNSWAARS